MKTILATFVLCLLATPAVARADKPVGLTCGGSVTQISAWYDAPAHTWRETDQHNCGWHKTYSWEVQYKRGGSWYDWSPEHLVSSGNCNTGCVFHGQDTGALCSKAADAYRLRAWWKDGRLTTPARTAAYAWSGGVI